MQKFIIALLLLIPTPGVSQVSPRSFEASSADQDVRLCVKPGGVTTCSFNLDGTTGDVTFSGVLNADGGFADNAASHATVSQPGLVSTGTQSFGGAKTFQSLTASSIVSGTAQIGGGDTISLRLASDQPAKRVLRSNDSAQSIANGQTRDFTTGITNFNGLILISDSSSGNIGFWLKNIGTLTLLAGQNSPGGLTISSTNSHRDIRVTNNSGAARNIRILIIVI